MRGIYKDKEAGTLNKKAGFTLVELMVTLVIVVIVIAGVVVAYLQMHSAQVSQEMKASVQQGARNAMDRMNRELMLAGYNGEVYMADSHEIAFSEAGADPDASTSFIWYYLDGSKNLHRAVRSTLSGPVLHDVVIAENVIALNFQYYDSSDAALTGLPIDNTTANDDPTGPKYTKLKTIRRIAFQFEMQSAKKDPSTGRYITMWFQSDLYPQNLTEGETASVMALTGAIPASNVQAIDKQDCAGSIGLKWTADTEAGVAGYHIEYGTTDGEWTGDAHISLGQLSDPKNPEYTLTGLTTTLYTNRVNNPTTYYIRIAVYNNAMQDGPWPSSSVYGNPNPDTTDFANVQSNGNDTTVDPKVPAPPTGLRAFNKNTDPANCGNGQIELTWTASPTIATVGYRLYRSTAPLTSYPISAIYLIADENGSTGTKLGPNTASYIDSKRQCGTSYYYAICSVNCDNTLIYGDSNNPAQYNSSSDYTALNGTAISSVAPTSPDLSGSKGGYKRVFVNLVNPVPLFSNLSTMNFIYSELWFNNSQAPVLNPDGSVTGGTLVWNSSQEGVEPPGYFYDPGISSDNSFVFNNEGAYEGNLGLPSLSNNTTYYFLAVSFDSCGNHSSATAKAETLATLCNDDPIGPPPTPTGVSVGGCGDTMTIDWSWPSGDYLSWLDLQGFRVYRGEGAGFTWNDAITIGTNDTYYAGSPVPAGYGPGTPPGAVCLNTAPLWGITLTDSSVQDGATYYYSIRATDCVWENVDSNGTTNPTETYDYIKTHNITPASQASIGPIYPGRIRQYQSPIYDNPPTAAGDLYNFATCLGIDPSTFPGSSMAETDYHNAVQFYIQNTSAGNVTLNQISLTWGNTAAYLKGIRIGGSPGSSAYTDYVFNTPQSSSQTSAGEAISVLLSDTASKATGIGTYSQAIPVILIFTNADGSVNNATDMRGDQIDVQIKWENDSTGKTDCLAYMDTLHNNPINVPGDPTIYNAVQNQPSTGTPCFSIPGLTSPAHKASDYHPVAMGGTSVNVSAGVGDSSETYNYVLSNHTTIQTQDVGFSEKDLYYTTTFADVTAISQLPAAPIPGQSDSNNNWIKLTYPNLTDGLISASIPSQDGKRVWFYLGAVSNAGNFDRNPTPDGGYYMYDQTNFDPCAMTLAAPANLAYNGGTLTWNAVTTYRNGVALASQDSVKYYVFKRSMDSFGVIPPYNYNSPIATVMGTSYSDPSPLTSTTFYEVMSANSCTTMSQAYPSIPENCFSGSTPVTVSNEVGVCYSGGGSGANIQLGVSSVKLSSNWTLTPPCAPVPVTVTLYDCAYAFNGVSDTVPLTVTSADSAEDSTITLEEIGDSGIFTPTGASGGNIYVTPGDSSYNSGSHTDVYQGATVKTNLRDTLTFTAAGASTTLAVTTRSCANTPSAPSLTSVSVNSGQATVNFTAPMTNTDGSTVDDLSWFNVYLGSKVATTVNYVAGQSSYNVTISVKNGQNSYSVTAGDTCNHESAQSNVIKK